MQLALVCIEIALSARVALPTSPMRQVPNVSSDIDEEETNATTQRIYFENAELHILRTSVLYKNLGQTKRQMYL